MKVIRVSAAIAVLCVGAITGQASVFASEEKTVDAAAPYDINNVFAQILRGERPADIVYEDEHALAFHDIYPKAKVHVLVIPKGPYNNIARFVAEASPGEQLGLLNAIQKVAEIMGLDTYLMPTIKWNDGLNSINCVQNPFL